MASYYAFAIWAFETVLSESLLRGLLNEPFWGLFGLIFSPIIAWWAMGDMDPAPLQAMDLLCTAPLLIGLVTFLLAALIIWSRRCKA